MQFIFTCKQIGKKKKKQDKGALPILMKISAIAWDIYSARLHEKHHNTVPQYCTEQKPFLQTRER